MTSKALVFVLLLAPASWLQPLMASPEELIIPLSEDSSSLLVNLVISKDLDQVEKEAQVVAIRFAKATDLNIQQEVAKLQELFSQVESEERNQEIKKVETQLQEKVYQHIYPRLTQILEWIGFPILASAYFVGMGVGAVTYHHVPSPYAIIAGIVSAVVTQAAGVAIIDRIDRRDSNLLENSRTICNSLIRTLREQHES